MQVVYNQIYSTFFQQQQQRQQQQHEMFTKLLSAGQQAQHLNQGGNQYSIPPPPPSLSPLPPELQVLVNNAQPSRELLQRPEAKAILQGKVHIQLI